MQRPSMRFVAVKSEDQQSTLAIHRVRETLVAQKTQLINALRAHLAEFAVLCSCRHQHQLFRSHNEGNDILLLSRGC